VSPDPELFWVDQSDKRRKRIAAALDLYEAAYQWRRSYERAQMDPDELGDPYALRKYDECRTNFGDDAFDLLMDYTAPID
jgi:hypothetical protein